MKEFYEMKVEEVMNSLLWDIPVVEKNADIKTVLLIIISRCYVWVVDSMESMKIEGVITEHDFMKMFQNFDPEARAGDFATKDLVYCTKDERVAEVMKKIEKYNVRRLPVVENGKIIGEVTLRDLIKKFCSFFS